MVRKIVGLVRSAAPKIRHDEGITINALAPGPVNTGINPDVRLVVPQEHMTQMKTVLNVVDKFIDEDITGQVAECTSSGFYLRDPIPFANESARFLNEDQLSEDKFGSFYEIKDQKKS